MTETLSCVEVAFCGSINLLYVVSVTHSSDRRSEAPSRSSTQHMAPSDRRDHKLIHSYLSFRKLSPSPTAVDISITLGFLFFAYMASGRSQKRLNPRCSNSQNAHLLGLPFPLARTYIISFLLATASTSMNVGGIVRGGGVIVRTPTSIAPMSTYSTHCN